MKKFSDLFLRQFLDKPIATYTHTTNKEVALSAVDVDTDTFTSVAHGLSNSDIVAPTLNSNVTSVYPPLYYQTPINNFTGVYYVVNKTDNTFQLSLTSGGAAIDLTTNATLDLTKWHFEVLGGTVTISNLPSLNKCRIIIKGKTLLKSTTTLLYVNNQTLGLDTASTVSTTLGYPHLKGGGTVFFSTDITIDYRNALMIKSYNYSIDANTAVAYAGESVPKGFVNLFMANGLITSITFPVVNATARWGFANGTTVEVYRT